MTNNGAKLTVHHGGQTIELAPGGSALIGRGADCSLRVLDERVSRHHARLVYHDAWVLEDVGSSNGTFIDGRPVISYPLRGRHRVRLGGEPDAPLIDVVVAAAERGTQLAIDGNRVSIGRGSDNTIVVDDLLVSRRHAEIVALGPSGPWRLTDLHSSNGTFVNGRQIGSVEIGEGDLVSVGDSELVVRGGVLVPNQRTSEALRVEQIGFVLPGGKALLDGISLSIPERSLTAVIGPSGAGKSTLLKVLTGAIRPSTGAVSYSGRDLFTNRADLRRRVGLVPQDDVMHRLLTVRQVLDYSAELRFPRDVPRAERDARISSTMAELGLTEHADTRVDRLSGGQRKRTSIAIEMLTRPTLLFLDEPTSGLDPNLERSVMLELRKLADRGQTVMVITHSLAQLHLCDSVILLAPGGKPTYVGTPDGLLDFFGAQDYEMVYDLITRAPDEHRQRFSASRQGLPVGPGPGAIDAEPPVRRQPVSRQISTMARRHLRVMSADRSYVLFTALLPAVLALLAMAVPGDKGFSGVDDPPSNEAGQLLVVLVIGALFMGMAASAREAVGERDIFRREAAVGVAPLGYLLAKLCVFAGLAAVQSALLVGLTLIVKPAPAEGVLGLPGWLELGLVVTLTTIVSAAVGLWLSTVVSTSEQVMPLLVVLVMAQLVLCGGLIPVADRAPLEQISWLAPGRWAYASGAGTVDLPTLSPMLGADELWKHDRGTWLVSTGVLGLMTLLASTGAWLALRRTCRPS